MFANIREQLHFIVASTVVDTNLCKLASWTLGLQSLYSNKTKANYFMAQGSEVKVFSLDNTHYGSSEST